MENMNSAFKMKKVYEDGTTVILPLDGEEKFLTNCPTCGEEHEIDFDEFHEITTGGDIWSSQVYCEGHVPTRYNGEKVSAQ